MVQQTNIYFIQSKRRDKIPAGLLDNTRDQIYTIRTEMKEEGNKE